mmetsp:Transcript_55179/g.156427  ORF Transcript_55179/g.156427 Transcript_55179/m.156427 type:complete len:134 (+) Transcript_55179:154-555(+)
MREVGFSYLDRCAASVMSYGVGRMTNEVTQSGDEIGVVSWSPKGTFTNMLRIDGSEQETVDPLEGRPIRVVLAWEALLVDAGAAPVPALVTRGRRLDVDENLPENSRFLHGEEMCLQQTSPSGLVVRRYFKRQ